MGKLMVGAEANDRDSRLVNAYSGSLKIGLKETRFVGKRKLFEGERKLAVGLEPATY